ncbi:MAG: hypothetical protein JO030_00065 [Candidatus Eremiobacteraeota bacterium]|nr:hypothetical protein [Candidatus Eremiobacteraeota bacterium]
MGSRAAVEFCPATLVALHPTSDVDAPRARESADVQRTGNPSTDFTYHLIAQTPRTLVTATMVADTDGGWHEWHVDNVAISEKTPANWWLPPAIATSPYARSGRLTVSFPRPVSVRHAWVAAAQARGDNAPVGGDAGMANCDVPGFFARAYDSQREPPLGEMPPPSPAPWSPDPPVTAASSRAQRTAEPLSTDCAKPFGRVALKEAQQPDYPYEALADVRPYSVEVAAAIGAHNDVVDAWIYYSSGNRSLDLSALRAARASKYFSAVSYCRTVPGYFLFRADYWPGP